MKITEEIKDQIVEKYQQGLSQSAVAKIFDISQSSVYNVLKERNIKIEKRKYKNKFRYSDEKEAEILKLYESGKTQKEIGIIYNTSNTAIRRVLIRNGVTPRGIRKTLRLCKNNPFKRNDEFSEYFLGLLITDGCIARKSGKYESYEICLSLTECDGHIIEQFRDWASPKAKVSKVLQKLNNSYMYSISITNEEMVEWLRRKGNFYRKSYEAKLYYPLNWNILRGIVDGDGGFHVTNQTDKSYGLNMFVCGLSLTLMKQVQQFLVKNGIRASLRTTEPDKWHKNGLYYVEVRYYEDVIKVGLNMYSNASIFIKRKYERWLAFYESRKNKYTLNSGKETAIQP